MRSKLAEYPATTSAFPRPDAPWLGAALLLILTFSAYIPATRGGFVWDDDVYAANPLLAKPDGLSQIWTLKKTPEPYYREFPVVYTSFWLERRVWGLRLAGYHVVNIILHVINAILAWFILSRLGLRGAWFAAAIFALHPVHVESVAWISERKNVLSTFFYLLALGSYLRFEDIRKRRWYFSSLMLFSMALLSKPVTCTLPVILLLLRWQRGLEIRWREAKNLFPFFLLAIGMGLFTLRVEVHSSLDYTLPLSWPNRMLLAARALWFYPMKLAWPINLTFSYARWGLNPHEFLPWLWVVGTLAAVAWIWRMKDLLGRGVIAGLGFYVITISPLLGFANIYTFRYAFVADHYQYLASLGLIATAVGSATWFFHENTSSKEQTPASRRPSAGVVLGSVVLLSLAAATWRQACTYRDSETLWEDVLSKNPASGLANNQRGLALAAEGKFDEAIRHYNLALRAEPNLAMTQNNLGIALAQQGKLSEAMGHFRLALQAQPDWIEAYNNLGLIFARQGKFAEAAAQFNRALQIQPLYSGANENLAILLAKQGRLDDAIRHYRLALEVHPDLTGIHNSLGLAYAQQGKINEAIEQFNQELQIQPSDAEARFNLGRALAGQGKIAEASEHFRLALQARPDYLDAYNGLGITLAMQGKRDEAIETFRQALRLKPDYAPARGNLEAILRQGGSR